jgi:Zn-dependent protease with chaperone function
MTLGLFEVGTILTLVLPAIGAVCCWRLVMRMDEAKRPLVWHSCVQGAYAAFLAVIGIWWCFWDAWQHSIPSAKSTSLPAFVLLAFPILPIGIARFILVFAGAPILNVRWDGRVLARIALWRTVGSTLPLIFLVLSFEALYERTLACLIWLAFAAMTHFVGKGQQRRAEAWKLTPVKSGDLHKRTFQLAREQDIRISRVCVVPVGKGHLTNAYGAPRMIAVTENYSRFNAAQLDFIICHELVHARRWHGVKNLLAAPIVIVLLAFAALLLPHQVLGQRLFFDQCVIFLPILFSCAVSRHFEFAADAGSVRWTKDVEAASDALRKVCAAAQIPEGRSMPIELFATHPNLIRRLSAIQRIALAIERARN